MAAHETQAPRSFGEQQCLKTCSSSPLRSGSAKSSRPISRSPTAASNPRPNARRKKLRKPWMSVVSSRRRAGSGSSRLTAITSRISSCSRRSRHTSSNTKPGRRFAKAVKSASCCGRSSSSERLGRSDAVSAVLPPEDDQACGDDPRCAEPNRNPRNLVEEKIAEGDGDERVRVIERRDRRRFRVTIRKRHEQLPEHAEDSHENDEQPLPAGRHRPPPERRKRGAHHRRQGKVEGDRDRMFPAAAHAAQKHHC